MPYAGTVRVKWQLKSTDGGQVATIVVNSRIESCNSTTMQTTYTSEECDIRVAAGDLLLIMGSVSNSSASVFVRNVRVYYDLIDSTGLGAVKTN